MAADVPPRRAPRRTIVVTGAGGVLGRALVDAAVEAGERVIAIDLAAGVERPGVAWHAVDLTEALPGGPAAADLPPVAALYAAAGGFAMDGPAHALAPRAFAAMWRMNVETFLGACRLVVPAMPPGGAIVAVGAAGAMAGAAGMGSYAMAKSALHRLVETMAEELRPGIRVNAVCPTILDTAANRAAMPGADRTRWVSPADAARAMRWLAGADAAALSGQLVRLTEGPAQAA